MAELAGRDKIESDFARKLSYVQAKHRHELEELMGSPPDIAKVPESFWAKVQKETEEQILAILLLIFLGSYVQHSGEESEDSRFLAVAFAGNRAATVAKEYTVNSVQWLVGENQRWQTEFLKTGERPNVAERLLQIFGPNRAQRIAVTETTAAATAGGEAAVSQGPGLSLDDIWITERDEHVCPICKPLDRQPRSVWSLKFPLGSPAHPVCRCYIQYAHEAGAWLKI